jgi:hypothetical protein
MVRRRPEGGCGGPASGGAEHPGPFLGRRDNVKVPTLKAATGVQRRVLVYVVWFALAVMLLSRISLNVVDPDIFHLMALARESLVSGHVPTTDLFSYGPTKPYVVQHEWGSGAIAYFVATRFGAPGILLLKYLLAALLAWLCVATARVRNPDPLPALCWLAPISIFFTGAAFSPIRGHLYSMIFTACLLYFLEGDRRGNRRWTAIWLLLSVLWFNLHGGAVVGVLLLGAHAFEQFLRGSRWLHLVLVATAMLAGAVVNPYGTHYYPYLWQALRMSRPAIAEWRPVWDSFPSFNAVTFLLSLLLLLYLAARIGVRAMPGIVILCATAAASALHIRMFPFYGIVWACYVPGYLLASPLAPRLKALFDRPPLLLQAAWMIVAMFFLNVAITYRPWILNVPGEGNADEIVYPTGAVQYLADRQFRGNAMVPFEYGAYVSWKLYPAVRVAVDSRYEVAYPSTWVDEVFRLYRASAGWQQTLAGHPTDVILVRPSDPLARAIGNIPWRRVYVDRSYSIYARPGLNLPSVDYHDRAFPGRFP